MPISASPRRTTRPGQSSGAAGAVFGLGLHRLRDAELLEHLGHMGAASAAADRLRQRNRFCRQQRSFESFGRGEIRPRRALRHRNADQRARHLDQASGNDLAALDQLLGAGAGDDGDVGRLTVEEAFLQHQRRPEADGEAVAGFPLESRRQLLEHHFHGGRAQYFDFDGGSHAIPLIFSPHHKAQKRGLKAGFACGRIAEGFRR